MFKHLLAALAVSVGLVTAGVMATVEEDGSGTVAGISYCVPGALCDGNEPGLSE